MLRFFSAIVKIAIISLITGVGLSLFDLTAADVLAELGLTPENALGFLERGARWAIPNIVLGSMVIVPIWLVVFLLRPPRG